MIPRRMQVCRWSQFMITRRRCVYAALLIGTCAVTHAVVSTFVAVSDYATDTELRHNSINTRAIVGILSNQSYDKSIVSINFNGKESNNMRRADLTIHTDSKLEHAYQIASINVNEQESSSMESESQLEHIHQTESGFSTNKVFNDMLTEQTFSQDVDDSMYNGLRSSPTIKISLNESYPRLSKDIITPQDFKLILTGRDICGNSSLLFIVIVPTIHAEAAVRKAIRDTWGSYKGVAMRTAFLLGAPPTAEISAQIHRESAQYGDIVMADFGESYTNLTYKVLMGLRWARLYCHSAEFIVKADSDMFLNISALVTIVRNNPPGTNGTIYGMLKTTYIEVLRKYKYAVSREMYPYANYPQYITGGCYILSMRLALPLYMASQRYPYLSIEDALITGCLAEIVGAQRLAVNGFIKWRHNMEGSPCHVLKKGLFTLTRITPRVMYALWSAMQTYPSSCDTLT